MVTLEPRAVFGFFNEITQIPRASKKEEKIGQYLVDFAKKHNLSVKKDRVGNILIEKPATAGYQDAKKVILQAHQDMVCEKNSNVIFNFDTDPIKTQIDGDFLKAKGTTLGADNGIGVAMALAVLESTEIQHPALECLFTVDEETGLTGAFALEADFITGDMLINLDSEDDGQIFVGCAGGIGTTAKWTLTREKIPDGFYAFRVNISGLQGGHSGDDINKNRANANKLLNRFLWEINAKTDLRLAYFNGGNLHNAIPREAVAAAIVPLKDKENLSIWFNIFVAAIENEWLRYEPNIKLELETEEAVNDVIAKEMSDKLLDAIYACPNGIAAMSPDLAGLVETSTNLASVKMPQQTELLIVTSQRSSLETAKYDIAHQVQSAFRLGGATVELGDGYPGWQPNMQSEILKVAAASYETLFGEKPLVRAIHAGLECGLFKEKRPTLDMISIGPQMYGVHSPDERLSITSTLKTWKWLIEILKNVK
ncbi:MAG: aminoacyl-histidine dipeptidase [Prevotellaceae bacterium]|jgi:dipeptidase D|nr:aminoacyl-histidine dipeptidase [Prevotellaceae bacterium]